MIGFAWRPPRAELRWRSSPRALSRSRSASTSAISARASSLAITRLERRARRPHARAARLLRRLPRLRLPERRRGADAAGDPADPHEHLRGRSARRTPRRWTPRAAWGFTERQIMTQGRAAARAADDLRRHPHLVGERRGHGHDRAARERQHARHADHQRERLRRRRPLGAAIARRAADRWRSTSGLAGVQRAVTPKGLKVRAQSCQTSRGDLDPQD